MLAHVARNFGGGLTLPPFFETMLERRWLGDKTKQGFYKKEKDADGKEVRLVLDWKTLEYKPSSRPKFPSLEMAKNSERLAERLPQLLSGDVKKDRAVRFHTELLNSLWRYAAECLPEIADDAASVDRAMRAGFNWEMGPFQLWDAAGIRTTPWYRNDGAECFDPATGEYRPVASLRHRPGRRFKSQAGVVKHNPGAS